MKKFPLIAPIVFYIVRKKIDVLGAMPQLASPAETEHLEDQNKDGLG